MIHYDQAASIMHYLLHVVINYNEVKNISNISKHGISFEEASAVLLKPDVIITIDEGHTDDEIRYHAVGFIGEKKV